MAVYVKASRRAKAYIRAGLSGVRGSRRENTGLVKGAIKRYNVRAVGQPLSSATHIRETNKINSLNSKIQSSVKGRRRAKRIQLAAKYR